MGRYTLIALLSLGLLVALLAGCGSSSEKADTPHPNCSPTHYKYRACLEEETATREEHAIRHIDRNQRSTTGRLPYVGTIKASDGQGTTFIDRYRIGPLSYGEEAPPSSAVLKACGVDSPSETAASVFARGQISVIYSEGSLPEVIAIGEAGTVIGEGLEGVLQVASFVDGQWQCLGQEEGAGLEIQPGESMTFPIWLVGDLVLSNSRPRLTRAVLDSLHFYAVGGDSLAGTTPGMWSISGPGAALCDGEKRLLVYGRPPVRLPSHRPYGGMTCRVP